MRRILPIVLVVIMVLLAFVSCRGQEETPTTTEDITSSSSRVTTSRVLNLGVDEEDEGWAFWTEF